MAIINISIEKKHLIILSCLIAIFGIVLVTNAYSLSGTGGTPEVMGHSADELDIEFEGSMQSIQNVFNSLDSNGDGIIDDAEYASSAGAVHWDNVNNKPDVATRTWVNNQDYSTENYVDNKVSNIDGGIAYACNWNGWEPSSSSGVSCGYSCDYCCSSSTNTQIYCDGEKITDIKKDTYCTKCCTDPNCGSCLVAGTQILMADGSHKNIENVQVGDLVKGPDGYINKVLALERPSIADRGTYIINNEIELTGDHPILTTEGWKVANLEQYINSINMDDETMKEIISDYSSELDLDEFAPKVKHRLPETPENLEIGDIIITKEGKKEVKTLEHSFDRPKEETVYEIALDGNNAYYAEGYIVHNR